MWEFGVVDWVRSIHHSANEGAMEKSPTTFDIDLEADSPFETLQLAVPVEPDGLSKVMPDCRPADPSKTFFDLDKGDVLLHEGKRKKIIAIRTF